MERERKRALQQCKNTFQPSPYYYRTQKLREFWLILLFGARRAFREKTTAAAAAALTLFILNSFIIFTLLYRQQQFSVVEFKNIKKHFRGVITGGRNYITVRAQSARQTQSNLLSFIFFFENQIKLPLTLSLVLHPNHQIKNCATTITIIISIHRS